uniref:Neuropeptide-like1 transcript a n=1 Tax=Carabus violaceus TaxID=41075 RepID=A0A7U3MCA8_CARVO|nr:neuropeptide-like precursor1 transcript a [Carabus violaceus]
MGCSLLPNIVWITLLVFGVFVTKVKPDEDSDASSISTCELNLARLLLLPPDSMQVQALKRELYRYLEAKLEEDELTKRSLSSLVRDGKLPYLPKRNLEALARSGYLKPALDDDMENDDLKRSIANLAKNGQLPTFQKTDDEQTKRGIQSLARNGDLPGKREIDNLLSALYEKRNIGALARGFNFPVAGKRYIGALARTGDLRYMTQDDDDFYDKRNIASIVRNSGKRSIASLVRSNNLPNGNRYIFDEFKRNIASIARTMGSRYSGKRAVPTAALLRQDSYMNGADTKHYDDETQLTKNDNDNDTNENDTAEEKRNIASLKAQMKPKFKRAVNENDTVSRNKRQASNYWEPSEEYPVPVYQNNNVYDYEELMHALTGVYPNTEKRFLGSVARSGWFRSPSSSSSRFRSPTKRHIGSLARLGWLPALRSARRFNRSGRSASEQQVQDYNTSSRSDTADGAAEDDTPYTEESLVDSKRFLLLPAVDNILLRKLYSNMQSPNQDPL